MTFTSRKKKKKEKQRKRKEENSRLTELKGYKHVSSLAFEFNLIWRILSALRAHLNSRARSQWKLDSIANPDEHSANLYVLSVTTSRWDAKLVEKSATRPHGWLGRGFGSVERYTSRNASRYNSTCRSVISSFSSRCETIAEARSTAATKTGPWRFGDTNERNASTSRRSIPRNLNSRSRLVANNHGCRRRGSFSQSSIIISHAVATEHIPVVADWPRPA